MKQEKIKIKSLFISDLHLGNKNSQADKILEVFKKYEFKNLFLIGDIIDMTYMKRKKFSWNETHLEVIQKILKYSKDVNIYYIIGNHDMYIRNIIDSTNIYLGNILICDDYIYETETEKIYITHGDQFDGFIRMHTFIYWLGDTAYELSIKINKVYNFFRKIFGLNYWSLSSYLKSKVKNAIKYINEYEKISKLKLKEVNCNSILMGHTHSPKIIKHEYYNTGDFIENCSYIIEDYNGNLKLNYI
jgi:UDP-2,3-diacylglucosamine pyrophosphatase LpxH